MAIFDDIALLEQSSGNRSRGVTVTRITAPAAQIVEASDVISHLKLPSGSSETNIDRIIVAVTNAIEKYTNRGFIKQVIRQTHNQVGPVVKFRTRPVISVTSVETIAAMAADTLVTMSADDYALSIDKDAIRPRTSWPSHRGWSSFVITYAVGYYDLPDNPDDADKAAARLAVPADIREAVLQWIGHFYDNREGQSGELKYEVVAKRIGVIPSNVAGLIEPFQDRRLSLG